MLTANINTKKVNDLIANIRFYQIRVKKDVDDILAGGALDIESTAKELAAVDKGLMRSSIHMVKENVRRYKVSCNVNYAIFVEFGTVKMAAQPFMFPAYLMHRDDIIAALKVAVKYKK
jgi:HK97 gp10 family phage protein